MKKLSFILALIIALTGMIGLFATSVFAAEDAGYTYDAETNTYTVTTADGLIAVSAAIKAKDIAEGGGTTASSANKDDANIVLAADIDMSQATGTWDPICNYGNGVYVGTIDGQGHTISNFADVSTTANRRGLIARAGGCTVKNLNFVNAEIKGGTNTAVIIGSIFGGAVTDTATIENCTVIGAKVNATSYVSALVGGGEAKTNLVIKDCIVDAEIVGTDHVGVLMGGESKADAASVYAFENIFVTGSVTGVKNSGLFGYFCDLNVNITDVLSLIEAKGTTDTTNVSTMMSNAKRCNVTMNNVVCTGDLIASADALGEKVANTFVINNVAVFAAEAAKVFKASVLNGTNPATLTVDGVEADFATATVPAADAAGVLAKIEVMFADNATLKAAAMLQVNGWSYDEATDTYTVATADGFIAVSAAIKAADNDDANIVIVADIDMAQATGKWDPICNYSGGVYIGTIDGQGHTIKNFTDIDATQNRRGLISRAGACTVKNLTFVDAVVTGKDNTAVIVSDIFGGVAGETVTIENCKVINATVTGASYTGSLLGKGTKELNVVIKNCVVEATVSGGAHVGFLIGGEAAAVNTTVYTIEDIVASGTVSGATNAGLTGYFCDITVNFKNIVSCVEALKAGNTSSVMASAKRCAVTMTNVVCLDSPIASADALGEKIANDFVINNVYVIGTKAFNVFKAFAVNGTNSATLTVDGQAADFATATINAVQCANANNKVAEIFAENAGLKAAAEEMVGPMINHVIPEGALSTDENDHWYNCSVCNEAVKTAHTFDKKVTEDAYVSVPATCTAYGEYFYSCECGYKGTETFVSTIMLGHSITQEVAEDKYLATAATCTAPATYYKSCVCGLKGPDTFVYGDVLPHTFVEVVDEAYLNTPATCTAKATYFKTCTCGAVSEETFEAGELVAHVFDQQVVADEYLEIGATCITPAEYYYSCVCGLKGEEIFTVEGFVDHVYGDWYVAVEPSINAEGKMEKACTVCGDKQSEPIPSTINSVKDTVLGTAGSVKDKVTATLGCGGSIGGTSIIIMIAAAGAVIARKKKED